MGTFGDKNTVELLQGNQRKKKVKKKWVFFSSSPLFYILHLAKTWSLCCEPCNTRRIQQMCGKKKYVEQENKKNEKTGRELCIAAALLSDDPSRATFPNLHLKDYRMLKGHSIYKTRIQLYYLLLLLLYTGRENKVIESLMNNKRRQRREWICFSSVAPASSSTIHTHLNPSAFWIDSDADYIKRKRIECKKEARMKKRRWTNRKKVTNKKKNTQEEEEKKKIEEKRKRIKDSRFDGWGWRMMMIFFLEMRAAVNDR